MRMEQVLLTKKQAREQGLKHYFTGKPCKHGHIDKRSAHNGNCLTCSSLSVKAWQVNNREKARLTAQEWRDNAKQTEKGRFRIAEAVKKGNQKREADPVRRAEHRMRTLIRMAISRDGSKKAAKTEDLLGCTVAEARAHLEAQFLPGMSWENHGEWHIDHIRPCASFDFSDPAQQRECSHYSNLQPLWAQDNLSKSDKWEPSAEID